MLFLGAAYQAITAMPAMKPTSSIAKLMTAAVSKVIPPGAADVITVDCETDVADDAGPSAIVYHDEMLFVMPLSAICVHPAGCGTAAGIGCGPPSKAAIAK